MAALTGNQIKNSYPGLLKTTDNGALHPVIPGVITDGVGNTTPLKLSQNAVEVASDNILITDAAQAAGIQIDGTGASTVTIFAGAVDFASATGFAGLPQGMQSGTGTNSIISSPDLTDLDATAAGSAAVAIGRNAIASQEGSVGIGNYAQSTGSKGVAIGQEVYATAAGAVALGFNLTASTANTLTVHRLQLASYLAFNYADDTAAAAGGIPLGGVYHTDGALKIRIA